MSLGYGPFVRENGTFEMEQRERREAAAASEAAAQSAMLASLRAGNGHCPLLAVSLRLGSEWLPSQLANAEAAHSAFVFSDLLLRREQVKAALTLPESQGWEEVLAQYAEGKDFCRRDFPGQFTRAKGAEFAELVGSAIERTSGAKAKAAPAAVTNNPFAALAALRRG